MDDLFISDNDNGDMFSIAATVIEDGKEPIFVCKDYYGEEHVYLNIIESS